MNKKAIGILSCIIVLVIGGLLFSNKSTNITDSNAASDTISEQTSKANNANTEMPLVRIAATPFSGNVLVGIAQDKGFFTEEGINVELQLIVGREDSQAALAADHVDILSTYGTAPALHGIAAGNDITIFGGYMLQGCMPILAREETEWHSVQDFVGKRIIGNSTTIFIIGSALKQAGYDPYKDVEWVTYVDDNTNMELLRKGEADYLRGTTGLHTRAKELGLKAVAFCGDLVPEYSCCRIWSKTKWLNENHDTAVKLMKALIRAQAVFEKDRDYAVQIVVGQTDLTKEYAEGFIKNDHLMIRLDPHWEAVSRQQRDFVELGLLEGDTSIETLKAHFNPSIYKQALDECAAKYHDENPEFYDYYLKYYEKVNADFFN